MTFPGDSQNKYLVLDFSKYRVDDWAELNKWTQRSVTRIGDRTTQATIRKPGKSGAYYIVKFSTPFTGFGTINELGVVTEGADNITGTK